MIEVRQQVAMILMDALVRWDCTNFCQTEWPQVRKKWQEKEKTLKRLMMYVKYTLVKSEKFSLLREAEKAHHAFRGYHCLLIWLVCTSVP